MTYIEDLVSIVIPIWNKAEETRGFCEKAIESIGARDLAAEERAADIIENTIAEKEARDAINSVDADDAQLRLNCLRLERLNRFPEPCRRYRGGGGQADPE